MHSCLRVSAILFLLFALSSACCWADPSITSISPTVGPVSPVGSPITINGSGFGASPGGSTVSVGGQVPTPTFWSDTKITVPVPSALLPGSVDVIVTVGGVASNAKSFLVIPVVTGISPATAPVGGLVTLTGTSFGDTQQTGMGTVTFNGLSAAPTAWSNTSITFPIPVGASSGSIVVTVNGFAYNSGLYLVSPKIDAISPASGPINGPITLTGSGFGAVRNFNTVTFGGVTAAPTSWSDTGIALAVPAALPAGNAGVIVTVNNVASNTASFVVTPSIAGLSANSGLAGASITITGTSFGASQGGNSVTFNGLPAGPSSWSDTSITVPVPNGATTGPIVVTANGAASNTVNFTVINATPPVISSLSTLAGSAGTAVTVLGSNFGAAQNGSTITLNGVSAPVQTWSDIAIAAIVPNGASSGNWIVTVAGQQSNGIAFTVLPGALSGSFSPTVTSVTLTSPLARDWQHWGTSDALAVVSDGVVSPILKGFTVIGANTPARFGDGEIEYSWADGDLLGAVDRTTTGVLVTGTGNGFHLSIPAETPETLLLYVGAWEAQGHLTASLSDNSAPNFTDSSVDIVASNGDHHVNGTYTLSFQAGQPGQTLNIDYVLAVDHGAATGVSGNISLQSAVLMPQQPSVTITSPTDRQTFTYPSDVPLAANASQEGAAISTVSFFSDLQQVFSTSTSPYAFALGGLTAGDHNLTATATDANGLSTTSMPVLISEVTTGGVLTASVDVSSGVDLSAGTSDWIHWGNSTPDRKAGIPPQISDFRTLANGSAHSLDGSGAGGVNYSWSSGTPTDSQTGTATQMRMQAYKNGFTFTVAADTTLRTLQLYVASGFGESTLRASLSDGSASPFVSAYSTSVAFNERVYTIQFQAASAGQKLTITDQVTRDDGFAYVALESASVSDQNAPQIDSVTPVLGKPGDQITITGTNFGGSQAGASVSLNGAAMNVVSWSDSAISATIPLVESGAVVVSRGLAKSNGVAFTVILPPPPAISFISPSAGNSGTVVTIFGSSFGSAQNNSTVTFNGLTATPNSWSDTVIAVPAPDGVHSGPLVVTTASGPSNGVQFTLAPGIRFSLQSVYVTPDEATLEIGGSSTFTLKDPSGTPVADAFWSVDNSALATISPDASTPAKGNLQALAPGEVTITGTSSLGTAQAKATIYAAGTTPAGTAVWGFYPQTQDNYFAATIKAFGSSSADAPYMYLAEGTDASDAALVNALDEKGGLRWRVKLNPITPSNTIIFPVVAPATNDGGILVETNEADPNGPSEATAFYRLGTDGKPLWTYSVPTVDTSGPAIGPDGTIYFWAEPGSDISLIALDDATGTEKFRIDPLIPGAATTFTSSEQPGDTNPDGSKVTAINPWRPCADFFLPGQFHPPSPISGNDFSFQPIVGTDGSVYVMETVKSSSYNYSKCLLGGSRPDPNGPITYFITDISGQLQYNESLQLLRLSPSGSVAATQIGSTAYSGQAEFKGSWTFDGGASQLPAVDFDKVTPNADGGALMTWAQRSSAPASPFQGFLTNVLNDSPVLTSPLPFPGTVGFFNGFGNVATNDQGTMFLDSFGSSVTAFDIASGNPKWTVPGALVAATNDGGALVNNRGSLQSVDPSGTAGTDSIPVGRSASYLAEGKFLQDFGSVQLVMASSPQLMSFLASSWAIPNGADPSSTYRASFYSKLVTIIGWINGSPAGVTTPPETSISPLLVGELNSKLDCPFALKAMSGGDRTLIESDIDRQYANAFLITHSANNEPPPDLNPKTPYEKTVAEKGDFRAYDQVRAALYTQGNQITYALLANSKVRLGDTPDACGSFLTRLGNDFAGGTLLKAEPHPDNGQWGITPSKLHFFQLAEGRVGLEAQKVNMTLNACTSTDATTGFCNAPVPPVTPYIWSFPLFDAKGQYTVNTQIFPTYYIYEEGKLVRKIPQTAVENFIKLNATSQIKAKDIQ